LIRSDKRLDSKKESTLNERMNNSTLKENLFARVKIRVMVFNATFNNISVILWRSVLFVVPGENHGHAASH